MNYFWMTLIEPVLTWKGAKIVLLSFLWNGFYSYDSYQNQSPECELISGATPLPVLEKQGDIVLGGLFSLHDMVVEENLSFTSQPSPTKCTRYAALTKSCQRIVVLFSFFTVSKIQLA